MFLLCCPVTRGCEQLPPSCALDPSGHPQLALLGRVQHIFLRCHMHHRFCPRRTVPAMGTLETYHTGGEVVGGGGLTMLEMQTQPPKQLKI
jgi:hypothetical protein